MGKDHGGRSTVGPEARPYFDHPPSRGRMLSCQADANIDTNLYELGMDRLINLDMNAEFIGKEALRRIRENGVTRKQVGMCIEGMPPKDPNTTFCPIVNNGDSVGKVTSAVYSPTTRHGESRSWCERHLSFKSTATRIALISNGSVDGKIYGPTKQPGVDRRSLADLSVRRHGEFLYSCLLEKRAIAFLADLGKHAVSPVDADCSMPRRKRGEGVLKWISNTGSVN